MKTCKNICKDYKAKGKAPSGGRYRNGQKRCQFCEIYIMWEGLYCPCCGSRLRNKPRNRKYKAKFREAMSL